MTTANTNPAVRPEAAPSARGGTGNLAGVSRPVRGDETKAFYKTTEFVVFIVVTIAVLVASVLVKAADGHGDNFTADKAWLYVVILSVGYIVSRGLAKSGSRHRDA